MANLTVNALYHLKLRRFLPRSGDGTEDHAILV